MEERTHVNAIDLIRAQHQETRRLLLELERGSGAARIESFESLFAHLVAHHAVSVGTFYPACRRVLHDAPWLGPMGRFGVVELGLHLCDQARRRSNFDQRVASLKEALLRRIEEEEAQLSSIETILDRATLDILGDRMRKTYEEARESDYRARLRDGLRTAAPGTPRPLTKRSGDNRPSGTHVLSLAVILLLVAACRGPDRPVEEAPPPEPPGDELTEPKFPIDPSSEPGHLPPEPPTGDPTPTEQEGGPEPPAPAPDGAP